MKFDELDDRMRVFETAHDLCVLPGLWMVARLDGRGFTRLTKEVHQFEAPFDTRFRDMMLDTVEHLMNCGFKVIYGYTESDEISLLLSHAEDCYNRKLRKLISILAGEASAKFSLLLGDVACFDCRICQLPSVDLVIDYFRWRSEDAHRNALNSHCYWCLRKDDESVAEATAAVKGLTTAEKNELLFQHGINYNDLPRWQKRGSGLYWEEYEREAESHYVLDGGKLVVAHAGMKEEMQGRGSGKVREFALYGETTGETDEFGLPIRYNWAAEYRGRATVVYGHTPVPEPEWLNRTTNIDTGCVFGGKLTALRWPEREIVSVPAARTYCEPARPFLPENAPPLSGQQILDDLLDADDVLGKRIIPTRLRSNVTIREENAMAALEVMSRFAANPKWLIYLPPTMSPCETSSQDGFLEHPAEAFLVLPVAGRPQGRLRAEAHGLPCGGDRVPG